VTRLVVMLGCEKTCGMKVFGSFCSLTGGSSMEEREKA
jgi:hypothetical protein